MDGAAIPDHQQPPREVGGQLLQEPRRIYTLEGPVLDPSVQPALGGDATDYRQMVSAEWYPEHWSLAPGRIGLDHQGQQVATRLVYEDDGPALVPAFFECQASAPLSSAGWLPRPAGWHVSAASPAPPILLEDAAHLGRVVLDPEVASDDLGHPGLGPDVATKAQGRWPWPAIPVAGAAAGGPIWAGDREVCSGAGLVAMGPGPAQPLADGPLLTPKAAAMRCCGQPSWDSSQARRRRPSRQLVACWEYSAVIHSSMPAIHPDV